jgi:hypothetical protein
MVCPSKEFKHLFRGPFILKTFGAHFTAITGSVKVQALGNLDDAKNYPFGGLGLSAAVVSDIFMVSGTPGHHAKT